MVAKMVADRETSVGFVASAVETHKHTVASRVEATLAPFAQGPIDVAALLDAIVAQQAASVGALVVASNEHDAELSDDILPREERDEAVAQVISTIVAVRSALQAGYGEEGARVHGVAGETPREPDRLLPFGRQLQGTLEDKALKLPKPLVGVLIDRAALAEKVGVDTVTLATAHATVRREQREAETTQDAKDAAMARHDTTFGHTLPVVSALFRLAGLTRTADRLVPSTRRPGQIDDTSPIEAEGVPPTA